MGGLAGSWSDSSGAALHNASRTTALSSSVPGSNPFSPGSNSSRRQTCRASGAFSVTSCFTPSSSHTCRASSSSWSLPLTLPSESPRVRANVIRGNASLVSLMGEGALKVTNPGRLNASRQSGADLHLTLQRPSAPAWQTANKN